MPTIIPQVAGPVAIRQEMQAGSNFSGTAPDDGSPLAFTYVGAECYFKFGAGTAGGGLFDFWDGVYPFHPVKPLYLVGVELDLANQTSWSVSIEDPDSNSMAIHNGTTESSFLSGINGPVIPVILMPGSVVKVVTAAATQALIATIKVQQYCP